MMCLFGRLAQAVTFEESEWKLVKGYGERK